MKNCKKYCEQNVIYGDPVKDRYVIVQDDNYSFFNIVHTDFFYQENAILFRIGHEETDWSDNMLMDKAEKVVDFLNKEAKECLQRKSSSK